MITFIATAKGLLVYRLSEGHSPELLSTHFIGFNVTLAFADPRNGRWWAGVTHRHWGQKMHFSDDNGLSWQEAAVPSYQGRRLPDGRDARLRQIWCMAHGGPEFPDRLWVGTDPGGLFITENNGVTFELVEGLWNHPSRQREGQWFGAGSDYPFLHSILVDPTDSNHLYVAVSCAGVFESADCGKTWNARNEGLRAMYLPDPKVEVGHDPHIVRFNPGNPAFMWQQNHCGIYYSVNGGSEWQEASDKNGIPYYGFALVVGGEPGCAWVIPVLSDEQRVAPSLALKVYKTTDFGNTWVDDSAGLPDTNSFDIVLRQSFEKRDSHMLFGTTNGNLYYRYKNESWVTVSSNLTKVNLVFIFE